MNLNDLIKRSNEMGVTDIDWIKRCYYIANQNDKMSQSQKIELFGNYVIKAEPLPVQNQFSQNQNQISQDEQTITDTILEQIKQQTLKDYIEKRKRKFKRQDNFPAGLRNIGNSCSINSTIQFLHQIPEISNWLYEIECKQNNSVHSEFIKAWQELSKKMTTTKNHCVNPKRFIEKLIFQQKEKEYFENKTQKDATEILLSILNKLDSSLRRLHQSFLMQTNLQKNECFGMQGLNLLFQITGLKNNNFENHPMLQVQADSGNLINYLQDNWANQISLLPQIMIFQINRIIFNQFYRQIERINKCFQFDKILNLDFLLCGTSLKKTKVTQPQYNQSYEKIQAQIKALEIVIDMYKNDQVQYTKLSLKKQFLLQTLESEQQNLFKSNLSSQNYFLHSVFVHIGGTDNGHIIVYIYNFYLNQWFKYNDEIVSQITENDMFQECEKDAVIIIYVNKEQSQKISNHCKRLLEEGNKYIR